MILLAICCCRLNSAPKRFGRGWKRYPKRGAAESKAVTTRRLSQGSASTREPDGTGDQRRCYATPAAFASTVAFPRFSFEGLWRVMKDSPTALSAITDDHDKVVVKILQVSGLLSMSAGICRARRYCQEQELAGNQGNPVANARAA